MGGREDVRIASLMKWGGAVGLGRWGQGKYSRLGEKRGGGGGAGEIE